MKENRVLEVKGIYKSFPGVKALQNVDFNLCEGEIHALMGENGAGKSTLIKVLTGVYTKDEGHIYLKGMEKEAVIRSPQDAQNLGISTVYQEITLCPNLSVAENMFIGRTKGVGQNWKKMNKAADDILQSLDIPAKATQQLASCSIAIQQMVAIARAVDMECKVLILDEPTSSLDDQEVQKLFKLMRDLKKKGVGIIFVTHFLDQVYEVCDKITVLRDGQLVGEYEIKDLPRVQLVSKMLGKELDDMSDIKGEQKAFEKSKSDAPVFEAEGLYSDAGIKPFDFHIMHKARLINTLTGTIKDTENGKVVELCEGDFACNTNLEDGTNVQVSVDFDDVELTDDEEDGVIGATIVSSIYKGSYYQYIVRTDTYYDFFVDSEYEWLINDRVGILIAPEKLIIEEIKENKSEAESSKEQSSETNEVKAETQNAVANASSTALNEANKEGNDEKV